jgi:hypothetical protein
MCTIELMPVIVRGMGFFRNPDFCFATGLLSGTDG